MSFWGINLISTQPLNLEQQHLQVKSILWFDIASYESAKVKFQQMYGGGQHKERWNKGALQASCKFGQLGRQFIHGYVKTAESQKSSRKNESSGAVAAPGQFL